MDDVLPADPLPPAPPPAQAGTQQPPPGQQALPPLRPDLRLIEGTAGDAQAPWKIHDPLAQRFFEIDQDAVDLMACWAAGTVDALRERFAAQTGRTVSEASALALLEFLRRNELLQATSHQTYARVQQQQALLRQRPLWLRLVHGYLFIKVPLARPDRFLRATQHLVAFLFSPLFWCALLVAGAARPVPGLAPVGSLPRHPARDVQRRPASPPSASAWPW